MSIIWAESFDFYGTSLTALGLRGYVYSATANNMNLVQNVGAARTGLGYFNHNNIDAARYLSRVFDTPLDVVGQGVAYQMPTVQAGGPRGGILFGTATAMGRIFICGNSSLGINVYRNTTLLGSSANNLLTAGSYAWIEAKATKDDGGASTGIVEVKVNGEAAVTVTGVDISEQFTRVGLGKESFVVTTAGILTYFDDWVIWDDNGTVNNDFLGDRRCATSYPDADGMPQEWALSSGANAWELIDETTPDDAGYIQAVDPADISEFEKQVIPIATNDIAALVVVARTLKTDAGATTIRLGVHSGSFVENGPETAIETTAAYKSAIFETDPNGDIQWTRDSANDATVRVTREA